MRLWRPLTETEKIKIYLWFLFRLSCYVVVMALLSSSWGLKIKFSWGILIVYAITLEGILFTRRFLGRLI